jgi:hypothetical protein
MWISVFIANASHGKGVVVKAAVRILADWRIWAAVEDGSADHGEEEMTLFAQPEQGSPLQSDTH